MFQQLPDHSITRSLLEHLGYSDKSSRAAPYLRAILALVKESSEEQLKQIPIIGPLLIGSSAALIELSKEEDDQRLEQRVETLLTVGEHTQEEIKFLTSLAGIIFYQQNEIVTRLRSLGLPTEHKLISNFAISAALIAYQSRITREYQYADLRGIEGITRQAHAASLLLNDVYVLPGLVAEQFGMDIKDREDELLEALLNNPDLSTGQRAQLEEEYAVLSGERWHPKYLARKKVALGTALAYSRQIVILGGPGVGKSVLIRYLAQTCAMGLTVMEERLGWSEELTPIVLPLTAFAIARENRPNLSLRAFLDEEMNRRGGEVLVLAIREEFNQGKAFVMLDGVDEILDSHARSSIVRAVDQFISEHHPSRTLVTSRPYGYIRLAGRIGHYQLSNFTERQVEEFVTRWQRAVEVWRHPDSPDIDHAINEGKKVLQEISLNPKINELANNPLMLVIISLLRYERAKLPEERVQLYHRAVITLLDTWNQWRSSSNYDFDALPLPTDKLIRVLGAVAEWMHHNKITGVVYRAELKREIVRALIEKEFDDDDPEATAEKYLESAAGRTGLLEERGPNIFSFWHKTFEEFLAAIEIATPTLKAISRVLTLIGDSRWREVILLAIGYVGIVQRDGDTATDIVTAIANSSSGPHEPLFHSRLRFALTCTREDVGVKRTLTLELISRLATIITNQPYHPLNQAFVETIRALPRLRPSQETINALIPLSKHPRVEVRMETARLCSNVAAVNHGAATLCMEMLDDTNAFVRCHAALGLLKAGNYVPEVWIAFEMFYDKDAHIKSAALDYLSTMRDEAIKSLHLLLADEDPRLRLTGSWFLHQTDPLNEKILYTLVSGLKAEHPINETAALMFRHICRTSEYTCARVISIIPTDDLELRVEAGKQLHRLSKKNKLREQHDVTTLLTPCLSANNLKLRLEAAILLYRMRVRDHTVAQAFTSCLYANELKVRIDAARFLSYMGKTTEMTVAALTSCLYADDLETRISAAKLLIRTNRIDEDVTSTLRSGLVAQDYRLRFQAASQLSTIVQDNKEVIRAFASCLTSDDSRLRIDTVKQLIKLGWINGDFLKAMITCLVGDDIKVRATATWTLLKLYKNKNVHSKIIIILSSCLHANDHRLRVEAGKIMIMLKRGNTNLIAPLVECLDASNELHVRVSSAQLLFQMNYINEQILNALFLGLTTWDDKLLRIRTTCWLNDLNREDELLETMIKELSQKTVDYEETYNRVLNRHQLTDFDTQILLELVQRHIGDTEEKLSARGWLFTYLQRNIGSEGQGRI